MSKPGTYRGWKIKPFRMGRFWHVSFRNARGSHILYCSREKEEDAVFEAIDEIDELEESRAKWKREHPATLFHAAEAS